ncbi:hypothetical protein [uncultured Jatrophihabitans sp.]|uniref:hypothetical protein n=1 Tax=uncultured Jatrophihabitans sp. TaxID=1610747 RepID=UPI0035CA9108
MVDTEQVAESDLRRRAAWLLGMLVLVAGLVVVLMLTLLKGSGGGKQGAGPSDPYGSTSADRGASSAPAPSTGSTASTAPTSASRASGTRSCPSDQSCALQGDPGGAIDAVNAYRAQHGQKRVDGTVSKSAQACALSNGSTCSGGWAESQVAKLDGPTAVKQIANIGNSGLLDSGMTSFEVGWAYNPSAHQYFIAIIHND